MTWLGRLRHRARNYRDLSEEIREHLDEKTDELVAGGLSPDRAREAARRAFGNAALIEERGRDAWGWRWAEDLLTDLRYGARQLAHKPLVAASCVATLGLGIGANAAVFSVVEAVLLRPLPFKDPARLVLVSEYRPGNVAKTGSPLTRYDARAARSDLFEETGGYWDVSGGDGIVFGAPGQAERLEFSIVTSGFFSILGVEPAIGRGFSPAELAPTRAHVFLASDALWRGALAADPAAVGRTFDLDGEAYTLIGVLPPGFRTPGTCDVWLPVGALGTYPLQDRASHQFWMVGRLRGGVDVAQAQAALDGQQAQFARTYPASDANWRVRVAPLLDAMVGSVRTALWVLFGAVAFVLLIACTNVVNLLLVRAVAREPEFALRTALGAGRLRLVRQALAEALLIAAAGAGLAMVLARVGVDAMIVTGGRGLPRFDPVQVNPAVLGCSAALALLVTVVVGIVPGLQASRLAPSDALREGPRTGVVSRRSSRVRQVLVVSEVALTLVLLSAAGLMLRTVARLGGVNPGFAPAGVTSFTIALPEATYATADQQAAFLQQLLGRLNATPGIDQAAATDRLPLSGDRNWGAVNVVGRPRLDPSQAPVVEGRAVSAGYFRTMGIPIVRGRDFTDADVAAGRRVTIVNQEMARLLWLGADPIGQAIAGAYHPGDPPSEVIGVAGNVKDFALDAASPPEMYSPYRSWSVMALVVKSRMDPSALTTSVRREVSALGPGVPVYDIRRVSDLVAGSIADRRFEWWLLGLFAAIALVLAAIGIYGVPAFVVSRRSHEIGLRLALGASRRRVLAVVVAQGMRLALLGLVLGLVATWPTMRLMGGLLFDLSPTDPLTLGAVTALLLVVSGLACALPAIRALRVSPMAALRHE